MTPREPGDVRLGTWAAVRLIAGREVSTRLRSRAYLIVTLVMTLLVVLLSVFFRITGGEDALRVGVADGALGAAVEASGQAVGTEITAVTVDDADGRAQVEDGGLAAYIDVVDGAVTAVVQKDLEPELGTALDALSRQLALTDEITGLGGDPAAVEARVAAAEVEVRPLEQPFDYDAQQLFLGALAGVLIYVALLISGQLVAQGVVEEKTSRVVELLLATVRPWQLMVGKVLGIGIVGLCQMFLIAAAGVAAAIALGTLTIELSAAVGTVVWLLVWFALGFVMYALVFAAAGALVSRQEEVGAVVTPVSMIIVIGYVVGISVLPSDPDNRLAEVLSLVPLFAPTLMPMRLAMGGVPVWQAALSVALVVALIPALVWLAGRIYRNAVMRTGSRVKLREALRQL